MTDELYNAFLKAEAKGLKREAKAAVDAFTASFTTMQARRDWVDRHIATLVPKRHSRLRHEIFTDIVLPVLWERCQRQDPWAFYWLARCDQNLLALLARSPHWAERLGAEGETALYRRAFTLTPQIDAFRKAYLDCLLSDFDYVAHHYPLMLISLEQDEHLELLEQLAEARQIDKEGACTDRLDRFETQLRDYLRRKGR